MVVIVVLLFIIVVSLLLGLIYKLNWMYMKKHS